MINREMQAVTILSFSSELDDYGQRRMGTPTETSADMVIKPYTNVNVEDPRFEEVEIIGLTKSEVSTQNRIRLASGSVYDVLHVQPGERYTQVFMRARA